MKKVAPIFVSIILASCSGQKPTPEQTQNVKDTASVSSETTEPVAIQEPTPIDTTWFQLPMEVDNGNHDFYFNDSTDFALTPEQFASLHLQNMNDCAIEDGCNYYALGQIKWIANHTTRLIYRVTTSWSEWNMWLVNYDLAGNYVDHLLILNGDNVEYISETFSTITPEKITVTEVVYNYSGGEEAPETTKKTYRPKANGKFH